MINPTKTLTRCALLLLAIALNTDAKQLYIQDFEFLDEPVIEKPYYQFPWGENFNENLMFYSGGCYRTSAGDDFDNWVLTAQEPYSGKRAFRVRVLTNEPNSQSKNCPYPWLAKEEKSRAEIGYGWHMDSSKAIPDWGSVNSETDPGHWYGYVIRIPSDQPGLKTWINNSTRNIITQLMGAGNGSNPEVHFMLGANYKVDVEVTYSQSETVNEKKKVRFAFNLEPDRWVPIILWRMRRWNDEGQLKIYVDCDPQKPQECTPTIDYNGPNAQRDKPVGYFKGAQYRSDNGTGVDQVVEYDLIAIHDKNSTLADVLAVYDIEDEPETILPPKKEACYITVECTDEIREALGK